MAGNTTAINEVVDPIAIEQFNQLKISGKELRTELSALLQVAINLNAALGGSTPATFNKNLQASTAATDKIIANNNRQIENEAKKAAKQEEIYNKYLVMLSKQEAARQSANAKEIQQAEAQMAKLEAIALRKANTQFPTGSGQPYNPVTSDDSPAVRYEPVITGNENMAITANKSAEAIAAENTALAEQAEVLAGLSTAQRANLELLLQLQAERAENITELKQLNVQDAVSGERLIFLTQRQIELGIAIKQTNLALQQQTKQMIAADTSTVQSQARLDELRVAYNNLTLAEQENIEIGGVWLAEIERLDIAVKEAAIDQGIYNKNVGNYTTATVLADKVSAQFVRQLVRLTAQFLLITVIFGAIQWLYEWIKNLDIFTGRLDQSTQNLKAFNEVQKNAANDAGQIIGKYRILSDTIKDLSISYADRLKAATELKKLFPEELAHSTAQAIANGTESASLDKLADSVVKLAKAKAAATEIEKTEGEIIALQIQRDKVNAAKADNIEATNKGKGFERLSFFERLGGGNNQASKKDLKQIFKNDADIANADIAAQIKVKEGTIKLLEQYGGLQKESEAIESKSTLNPKVKDTANTDLLESNRIDIEEAKKRNKAILDDDTYSYDARLVALNQYITKSKELLGNSAKIINADTNLRPQQRLNELKKLKNQELDIENERINEINKLDKSELERHKKLLEAIVTADKEAQQEQLEDLDQGAIIANQVLDKQKNKLINDKATEYAEGKISEKEYNEAILDINDAYNIKRITDEITVQQAILAIREATRDKELSEAKANGATPVELDKITSEANKGITPVKNKLGDLGISLDDAITKRDNDRTKSGKADKKQTADDKRKELLTVLDFAKTTTDEINKLVDAGYQNQISKLERIGQQINENAQIEKDAVSRSLDTQSNKARALAVIDAQTASQQKAIQQQIAAEKTKQARADKVAAIAKIILETAVAVVTALATPVIGPFLAAAAGAAGAVQLAIAVATPIPQFYKGTPIGGHKGGLAWYGERGRELVEEPGRQPYYSPGVATLVNLPKGTKVTPNNMLPVTPEWTSIRSDNRDVVSAIDRLYGKEQPRQTQPRLQGWVEAQRQADAWNTYSGRHFK